MQYVATTDHILTTRHRIKIAISANGKPVCYRTKADTVFMADGSEKFDADVENVIQTVWMKEFRRVVLK